MRRPESGPSPTTATPRAAGTPKSSGAPPRTSSRPKPGTSLPASSTMGSRSNRSQGTDHYRRRHCRRYRRIPCRAPPGEETRELLDAAGARPRVRTHGGHRQGRSGDRRRHGSSRAPLRRRRDHWCRRDGDPVTAGRSERASHRSGSGLRCPGGAALRLWRRRKQPAGTEW